jgi:hypothetical protein
MGKELERLAAIERRRVTRQHCDRRTSPLYSLRDRQASHLARALRRTVLVQAEWGGCMKLTVMLAAASVIVVR